MFLFLGIFLKIFSVVLLFFLLVPKFTKSRLQGLLGAWCLSYLLIICVMLVLSVGKLLNRAALTFSLSVICLGLCLFLLKRKGFRFSILYSGVKAHSAVNTICLCLGVLIFASILVHNLVFYDTTEDALTQGMTKLGHIYQHRSLFIHYNTNTINTFSNECLGELNGLYYFIFSGQDIAVGVGNAEIWLFAFLSFFWVTGEYDYQGKRRGLVALALSTSAVMIGLAFTIKTDLISICLLPYTATILTIYFKSHDKYYLFSSIMMLGMLASSKVVVLPAAGLLLISLVIYYIINAPKKGTLAPILGGAAAFCVFCYRYVVNFIQYGNPVQRSLNEHAFFSLENLMDNANGLLMGSANDLRFPMQSPTYSLYLDYYVLDRALGFLGYLLLAAMIAWVVLWIWLSLFHPLTKQQNTNGASDHGPQVKIAPSAYVAIPICLGFLCLLCGTVWYNWSFRYFAPYVFTFMIWLGADLQKKVRTLSRNPPPKYLSMGCALLLFISIAINTYASFLPGQAIPAPITTYREMPDMQKKTVSSDIIDFEAYDSIPGFARLLETGGRGLLLEEFGYPYYHLFGDNANIYLDVVRDVDELRNWYASDASYDLIVISSSAEDARAIDAQLSSDGYRRFDVHTVVNDVSVYLKDAS